MNRRALYPPAICCLLLAVAAKIPAADPETEIQLLRLHRAYDEVLEESAFQPRSVELHLLSNPERFQHLGECEAKELSAALLLFRREPAPNENLTTLHINLDGCDTAFDALRHNLGLYELRAGRPLKATYHLKISAASQNTNLAAKSLTALGDIAYNADDMPAAEKYFFDAYRKDSLHLPPMLPNNLCALFLTRGQFEEAAKWGKLALENAETFSPREKSGVPANYQELVLYNLFIAYVVLGQTEEATAVWEALDFVKLQAFPLQKAELLSMFTRLVNAPDLIQLYGTQIRNEVREFERAHPGLDLAYNADPLLWVFTEEADSLVAELGLRQTWQTMASQFPLSQPDSVEEFSPDAKSSGLPRMWPWIAGCLIISWAVVVAQFVVKRTPAHKPVESRLREIQLALQSGRAMQTAWFEHELKSTVGELLDLQPDADAFATSSVLNDSEKIVLAEAAAGTFPKDIARAHKWSPTYVYILRSSLRKKLKIPGDSTFAQWKVDQPKAYERAMNS